MSEFLRCAMCRVEIKPGRRVMFRNDGRVAHVDCPEVTCPVCTRQIFPGEPIRRNGEEMLHGNCWLKRQRAMAGGSAASPWTIVFQHRAQRRASIDPALYHYLKQRFEPDTSTCVILDRRRRLAPGGAAEPPVIERRRARTAEILSSQRVAVIRLTDEPVVSRGTSNDPAGQGGRESMEGMEGLDDRRRVDRGLEESQYLIGRMIPAYLDD